VEVFIGTQDDDGNYQGYLGTLETIEYTLLTTLITQCARHDVLSIDDLKRLSDIKDLLAQAQITLYDIENTLPETRKTQWATVNNALGETLDTFDQYRPDAPQLAFLLTFCILDAGYTEDNEPRFQYMDTTEEDPAILDVSIEHGAIEYIEISDEFMNVIADWLALDGREIIELPMIVGDDWDSVDVEIAWWRDNMRRLEADTEFNLTTLLFRAVRNNVLKSKRLRDHVLSHHDWPDRMEIL
jgi:hypothetical protein